MKVEKINNNLSLDLVGTSILQMSKADLLKAAFHLQSDLDDFIEYECLYKLKVLINERMKFIKDGATDIFKDKYGGSQTEKSHGFIVTLKTLYDYEYSEDVKNLEAEIKTLSSQLTQMKEKERKKCGKEVKDEILTFTLR